MPGRPAQLAAHLCSRLCAACAHALPTAPHHGKKTQERGMLRDEGRDGKKARDGGEKEEEEEEEEGKRGARGRMEGGAERGGRGGLHVWEHGRKEGEQKKVGKGKGGGYGSREYA